MIIHFIAPEDRNKWPSIWNKCFNTWAQTKYDINIWTDEGIDKLLQEDDKEFYDEYLNKIPSIYKWDYVRYIILYHYGGMYVDMDVELIDESFLNKLHPKKIYLMEGTGGTYVENSIMISPLNTLNQQTWQRIKTFAKNRIMNKFKDCKSPYNVVWIAGPQLMSEYFIKNIPHEFQPHRNFYDILAWEHFGNINGTFNFTKHFQTSFWNKKFKTE